MKTLTTYIKEALSLEQTKKRYKYHPKTKEELQELLKKYVANLSDKEATREILKELLPTVAGSSCEGIKELLNRQSDLVNKSVWAIGGDGWGYDIGYGGLDHVIASNDNINVLVLDTEIYSNTGGQASKSTPEGAIAKFAAAGKQTAKKAVIVLWAQALSQFATVHLPFS